MLEASSSSARSNAPPQGAFAKGGSSFYSSHKGHGGYDSFGSYGHGAHGKGKSYGEKGKASAPPEENYRKLQILPTDLADLTVPKDRTWTLKGLPSWEQVFHA